MPSVTQDWVQDLTMMQQSVLLTAVRGPDGIQKYSPTKYLLRWYRRCVLLSAMDGRVLTDPYEENGGSFTGPSFDGFGSYSGNPVAIAEHFDTDLDNLVGAYLRQLDELPHHFQLHFMHATEILGYKHPDSLIRAFWLRTYHRLVHDMHLWPETEEQMDARLGDNREAWLERNDPATVA